MAENSARVSIIIPLYNRSDLIGGTLDSIKGQSHKDFECIIIDDHSTDDSFERARKRTAGDDRFIVKRRTSDVKGAPSCRNEGVSMAGSEYLMFLDSDDLLAEKCLEERISLFRDYPELDFIVTQIGIFKDDPLQVTHYWNDLKGEDDIINFLQANGWQTSSSFFKTDFAKQFRYDEQASSWQDIEFHLRVLLSGPAYRKFRHNAPHVLIRRADSRTGMKATNNESFYESMEMRFELMSNIESEMTAAQKERYASFVRQFYLYYLEVFAITNDSLEKLGKLYDIYRSSYAFRHSPFICKTLRFYLARNNSLFVKLYRRGLRMIMSLKPLKTRAVPVR